ncbi:MAG: hypothetical protein CMJ29_01295 [Phycisphaerae bacterium]|nr:hypothetical protein [Phycisphaerae bacterium]
MPLLMSRNILRVLRLFLIIAGVAIVLWAIDWSDSIQIPAGEPGLDGVVLEQPRVYEVTGVLPTQEDPDVISCLLFGAPVSVADVPVAWYRPGIFTLLGQASLGLLLLGLLPLAGVYPLQATRWWILMRCRGLAVSWWRTLRLVFVGAFFNFCLPGTEGGDVVKAWYVAKQSDDRVIAVMSVVFDRITGLLGLIVLAAVAGVMATSGSVAFTIGLWAWGVIAVIAIFAWMYFNAGLRTWLGLERLQRLFGGGLIARIEDAAHAYGVHKRSVTLATLISVVVQILLASAATLAGVSLGITHDPAVILTVMPILFLAAAVPMSWQGIGVMEGLGILLLAMPDFATPNQVIGMLLIYRGYELSWSLIGSLMLLRGDIHLHPERHQGATEAVKPGSEGDLQADSGTMRQS